MTGTDASGCVGSDSIRIFVNPLPTPNATFNLSGGVVSFQNLSQNASQYIWDFGDGTPVANGFEPSHIYDFNGSYNVTLTATNDCGSVDITFAVNITSASLDDDLVPVGIQVFPNPVEDELHIELQAIARQTLRVQLLDLQGRGLGSEVLPRGLNSYQRKLNAARLPGGMYLLRAGATRVRIIKI